MLHQSKFAKHLLKDLLYEVKGNEEYEVLRQIQGKTELILWVDEPVKDKNKLENLQTWISEYTTTLLPILLYKSGYNNLCYFVDDFSQYLYKQRKKIHDKKNEITDISYDIVVFDEKPKDVFSILRILLADRSVYSGGENEVFYAIYKYALEEYRQRVIYQKEREFVKATTFARAKEAKKFYMDATETTIYKDYIKNQGGDEYINATDLCIRLNTTIQNVQRTRLKHNTYQLLYGNIKASEAIRKHLTENYAPRNSYDYDDVKEFIKNIFHIPNKDFDELVESEFNQLDTHVNPSYSSYSTYAERIDKMIKKGVLIYKTYQYAKCEGFFDKEIYAICKSLRDSDDITPIENWKRISEGEFKDNEIMKNWCCEYKKY